MYELRTSARMCCAVVRNRPTHTHIGNQIPPVWYDPVVQIQEYECYSITCSSRADRPIPSPDAIIIHPPHQQKKYILSDNNKCIIPPQRQTSETHERHLERFGRQRLSRVFNVGGPKRSFYNIFLLPPLRWIQVANTPKMQYLYKSRVSIFLLLYCVLTQVKIRFVCWLFLFWYKIMPLLQNGFCTNTHGPNV